MSGYVRKRGERSWELQYYVPSDTEGKGKYKTKTLSWKRGEKPISESKARAELRKILADIESRTYVDPKKMTVGEYLADWLKTYAAVHVQGTTFERYTGIVNAHLIPNLGHIRLQSLDPRHIREYYAEALKSGRIKQPVKDPVKPRKQPDGADQPRPWNPGLSPVTIRQHHAVLRKAMKCAYREQIIGRNPVDMVDPPQVTQQQRPTFTEEEVKAIVASTDGTPFGPVVLVAASTGMRLGEVLALTWDDVDAKHALITVTKSLEQTKAGLAIKEPKSSRGRRSVPVPTSVIDRLMAYREQQEARAAEIGELWVNNNLVCPNDIGGYRKPDSMSSSFRDIAKKAAVRPFGFHQLRHAHASMLANRQWDAKIIQERLGHSSISITMDIYSHVLPTTQRRAADSLGDVF